MSRGQRNAIGSPCVKCGTVLTEKNSRRVGKELRCSICHARRMQTYRDRERDQETVQAAQRGAAQFGRCAECGSKIARPSGRKRWEHTDPTIRDHGARLMRAWTQPGGTDGNDEATSNT